MAEWHLRGLRNAIEQKGWRIAEHPGDGNAVSACWEIQRSTGEPSLFIIFEWQDDLRTLPIEESFGCHVREHQTVNLYFKKRSYEDFHRHQVWQDELNSFLEGLNELSALSDQD